MIEFGKYATMVVLGFGAGLAIKVALNSAGVFW